MREPYVRRKWAGLSVRRYIIIMCAHVCIPIIFVTLISYNPFPLPPGAGVLGGHHHRI